jgi:hypothetical protein
MLFWGLLLPLFAGIYGPSFGRIFEHFGGDFDLTLCFWDFLDIRGAS